MSRYLVPLLLSVVVLMLGYAFWPVVLDNAQELKTHLITFKKYCLANPVTGYISYAAILGAILLAGLPIATIAMLLAGVIYSFWEAATLVTLIRLLIAVAAFLLARKLIDRPKRKSRKVPYIIRKFERNPKLALLLARLTPIPDSMVNYTIAAAPITHRSYVMVSLIGMIPFTLLCVWIGRELGTVSSFIRYIN